MLKNQTHTDTGHDTTFSFRARAQAVCLRLLALYRRFQHYRVVAEQRRRLAQMPDYLLKDMGITRAEALNEARKRFWE